MKMHDHLGRLAVFSALLTGCKAPRLIDDDPWNMQEAVASIPAVSDDDQPLLTVRVDDCGIARFQARRLAIPGGATGDRMTPSDPRHALEQRIARCLNLTRRFRVVSHDDGREMAPHYAVTCTILEMRSNEQASSCRSGSGPVQWDWLEAMATVTLGVHVVSRREGDGGRTVWDGEVRGRQSGKGRGFGVDSCRFGDDQERSTDQDLEAAVRLCVLDLVRKLAENVPTLSGATAPPTWGRSFCLVGGPD